MAAATGRHTPFPKTKEKVGGQYLIDLDALKELYLSGPDYDWKPFCTRNGFNPKDNRAKWANRGFNFSDWKREWIQKQVGIQDEEIAPEVLKVRKIVAHQRVKFVKDWSDRTNKMKFMLDAMLKQHGEALQHDIDKTLAIQAGTVQKKFSLSPEELGSFAATAIKLQELEMKSLLLVGDKQISPVIGKDGEAEYHERKKDDGYEIEVATMKTSGMSSAETARLLASYFDQAEEPKLITNGHANGNGAVTHMNGTNGNGHADEDSN